MGLSMYSVTNVIAPEDVDRLVEEVYKRVIKFFPWDLCTLDSKQRVYIKTHVIKPNVQHAILDFFGLSVPLRMRSPRLAKKS